MISFTIYGSAVPQGRPRAVKQGNFIRVYDPPSSKAWKDNVARQALEHKPERLMDGALKMTLVFKLQRPKSLPKKVVHHIKKPDVDNLVKAVKDALEGIFYERDQQVIHLDAKKEYVEKGKAPHVLVRVEEVEE